MNASLRRGGTAIATDQSRSLVRMPHAIILAVQCNASHKESVMGFKYKIDYIDFDAETFSDGSTQTYGNETRLRVFNAKGYELESVAFSPEEINDILDYVEVWEDHAACEVCADYAEKKRRAGNVDPHAEAEVYHNALFQEVQE